MKIISTDLKTVRELTKYISPKAIEGARFKKFNAPMINDGNLVCDEFFRTDELFNRRNDVVDFSYSRYGIDDVKIYDRSSIKAYDERNLSGSNAIYIESDIPYYVDIIGTNKRIYLENFGYKNPVNPSKVKAEGEYSGFYVDDILNVKYHSRVGSIEIESSSLKNEALDLLRANYPLELVLDYMERAKLTSALGRKKYRSGFLTFISQFPAMRNLMVSKDYLGNEVLDKFGMETFPKLCEAVDHNQKLAAEILTACKVQRLDNDAMITDEKKYKIAKSILNRNEGKWTDEDSVLVKKISNMRQLLSISKLLEKGKKSKEIIDIVYPQS